MAADGAAGTATFLGVFEHAPVKARVPATEVARRAGHGVAALLKIYAHCIDGQADAANRRITDALGTKDAEPGPGDEQDGDSAQAS
jgi:hypothetical protein